MQDGQEQDDATMQQLSVEDCWLLLATQQIGRLGVNARHYPLVVPVNYALDGRIVVVRTGEGTKLAAAAQANVTFEVDQLDPVSRTGWSVLIRGLAEEVSDRHPSEIVERTKAAGASPWAPGEHEHWLRIIPHHVTGRRIVQGDLPPAVGDAGYL